MNIKPYTEYRQEEILELYTRVGWTGYTEKPEMLRGAYENSLCILGAYENGKLVGIVRAVGDGASIVFTQDLLVLPEYQRQGIGKKLLAAILEKYESVYQIELLTDDTEKTVTFYRSMGFVPASDMGCVSFVRMRR